MCDIGDSELASLFKALSDPRQRPGDFDEHTSAKLMSFGPKATVLEMLHNGNYVLLFWDLSEKFLSWAAPMQEYEAKDLHV